jgi:histone H3/H4
MPPVKRSAPSSSDPVRRSVRVRTAPTRFRPGVTGELPHEYSALIRQIALDQARESQLEIESSAITELEGALEHVLDRIFEFAAENAKKNKRNIQAEDIEYAKGKLNFQKIQTPKDE